MNQQATSDEALLQALELVVKNVDKIQTIRRNVAQADGTFRIQQLEAEIQRLRKVNRTLHETLSTITTATPQTTVPSDSLVLTVDERYPDGSVPCTSMFVEGDWAKKLDKHAELVLSVQTEVTGFRVRSIEAVEDEGTGILRYIADCVMSNGIDDQIRVLPFSLTFVMEHDEESGGQHSAVQYTPGDHSHLSKDQRQRLKQFASSYTITRHQLPLFYPFILDVLRDIDHTSEPDSLDAPSPMVQENDGDKETGEIKKLTKLESPESPPDMADEEDEEAMDEN
ncbi:hypothetical protein VNI00_017682 [Paramarasmius palmivorus]|uniref:Uncharacterized protein n=1 Tax=Paramarasmius palmivorus TaxID=297713 RepID=A0AAW0B4J0_9AGAR